MQRFHRIRTAKFPVLTGEDDEVVNPGTYGKAFAEYLRQQLSDAGYVCPFICCEDWGWWVEVQLPEMAIGVCCYREHDQDGECDFVCVSSPQSNRMWSWRKFKRVDIGEQLARLNHILQAIFQADPEIQWIGATDEFPY